MSPISIARRLSQLSPQAKFRGMVGGDALFLPLCVLLSVALRLGSKSAAFDTAPGGARVVTMAHSLMDMLCRSTDL